MRSPRVDIQVNDHRLKAGGFRFRLKAGSVRPSADKRHTKIVIGFGRLLVRDVVQPHLVRYVPAAGHPVATCPKVLAPVALAQCPKLAQQLIRAAALQILHRPADRQVWRARQQQVDVVSVDRASVNHHLVATRRLPDQFPAAVADIAARHRVTMFRDPHQMILAIPNRAQTVWPPRLYDSIPAVYTATQDTHAG